MKMLALKTTLYVIELPFMVCVIFAFILLAFAHLILPEGEEEDERPAMLPKQPEDSLWQL